MKVETFKAGRWVPRYQYKSFEPVPVNHAWTWEDASIIALLEQTTRALGELNAFSLIVPDQDHSVHKPAHSVHIRPATPYTVRRPDRWPAESTFWHGTP